MALLDEVTADLPATSPLKLLHTGFLDEPRGLPGVNRLVRVVRFRRVPPGQIPETNTADEGRAGAAAASTADRDRGAAATTVQDDFRVSLQVAWNYLTDLKLQVPRTEGDLEVLTGIALVHRIHEALHHKLVSLGAVSAPGPPPPSRLERRVSDLVRPNRRK
jgi:hypothetical protein